MNKARESAKKNGLKGEKVDNIQYVSRKKSPKPGTGQLSVAHSKTNGGKKKDYRHHDFMGPKSKEGLSGGKKFSRLKTRT